MNHVHHAAERARDLLHGLYGELHAPPPPELDFSSLSALAERLRVPRRTVRAVELDAASLAHLSLPALVLLDGQLAIVRAVHPRVICELTWGVPLPLTGEQLIAQCGGIALELLPSLHREGGFGARVRDFLASRWAELTKITAASLALSGLGIATPLVLGMVIDRALPERAPKLLALIAFSVLFIAAQRALFTSFERRVSLSLHTRLEAAVTSSLFDHLLRIPYAALTHETVGGWLETLSGARRAQNMLTETLMIPLLHLLMGLAQGFTLLHMHPAIGGAVALCSLVFVTLSLAFALRASKLERGVIDSSANEHSTLFETLEGLPTLRTSGAQQLGYTRWLSRMLASRAAQVRMDLLATHSRAVLGATHDLISVGVLLWAVHASLHGDLSVGAVLALTMMSDRFLGLVSEFAAVLSPALAARSHLARVDALLAHPDVTAEPALPALPPAGADGDAIVLDDVWFRYAPDQPWVLEGYSLRVRSLEHFELRGPSGMGKSTILRIIAGLYVPERGRASVLGQPPQRLRGQICYLPQDTQLLSGSIVQNLRLLSGADTDTLLEAARRSGLDELVDSLPMGLETVLPAGASTLSGGQRQLIAWTAAMASRRKLLLMDEALSHVDPLMRARLLSMAMERVCTIVSVEHERRREEPTANRRSIVPDHAFDPQEFSARW